MAGALYLLKSVQAYLATSQEVDIPRALRVEEIAALLGITESEASSAVNGAIVEGFLKYDESKNIQITERGHWYLKVSQSLNPRNGNEGP